MAGCFYGLWMTVVLNYIEPFIFWVVNDEFL